MCRSIDGLLHCMAAISTTLFALLSPGRRAVTIKDAYGATYLHFKEILPRFGIQCEVCETTMKKRYSAAIAKGCDVLYLESPRIHCCAWLISRSYSPRPTKLPP